MPTLHLNTGNQPRLLFSSPVGGEVPSPVSPLDAPRTLPFRPSPLSTEESASNTEHRWAHDSSAGFDRNPTGDSSEVSPSGSLAADASHAATRNTASRHIRSFSVSKTSRDKPRRGMKGIRIVTNFSKQQDLVPASQQPAEPSLNSFKQPGSVNQAAARRDFSQAQGQQAEGFISLSDLKALDDPTVPKGFWRAVVGDGLKQKKRGRGKTEVAYTQKRKQPLPSSDSLQKTMALGFRSMNLRQNTRSYEEISDEDEVPILAPGSGSTAVEPTRSVSAERPGNGITADVGTTDQRAGYLAPSPTKSEDALSPSDRPIVIGFSIPSAKLSEYQLSPESASSDSLSPTRGFSSHKRNPSEAATITPTILVTPAGEDSGYVPFQTDYTVKPRPRARSSVYSQPSPHVSGVIPPMPAIPANVYKVRESNPFEPKARAVRDSSITVFEEDEDPKTSGRGVSTYTVFEEDDSPTELNRGRHASGFGKTKSAKRSSKDTVVTDRLSHGWWNYVTTPFLPPSKTGAGSKWERPVPWSPAKPSPMGSLQQEKDEKSWEKELSPGTESLPGPKPGHETMWSDMLTWEDERGAIGIAIDHTPRASAIRPNTNHYAHESGETLPGAAAVGGSQDIYQQNPYNPFRQVKYGVEAEPHQPHSSSPHSADNPFGGAHQPTNRQGQNPFLRNPPGGPNTPSRREPTLARTRSDSEGTEFEEDNEFPISRGAENPSAQRSGSVIDAGGSGSGGSAAEVPEPVHRREVEAQPPPYSPPRNGNGKFPRYVAVFPRNHGQPHSPGPLSPGMTQILSSRGAMPMTEVPLTPAPARVQRTGTATTDRGNTFMLPRAVPLTLADLERPTEVRRRAEARRRRLEKEDALARKAGGLWRGRACFSSRGCFGRGGAEGRKRRRWVFGLVAGLLVIAIVLAITLPAVFLKKRPTNAPPAQGLQWLNLTGFPPIPTSVTTVVKPDVVSAVTACVFPNTLWSCSLPKELQQSVSPNNPEQPNFKLQIVYGNDSTPASPKPNSRARTRSVAGNPVSAGGVIRDWILMARDAGGFQPAPPPPSLEDQRFLGKTTDNIRSSAKEGEETPLYISFLSNTSSSPTISKRQQQNDSSEFPDLTAEIPPPSLAADGTAAPANLLPSPLPVQQPVRLYDRGLPTEHYGFYNYFDRSIFLKSTALLNQSDLIQGPVPSDENGGATESEARVRCTWAMTRFLVQIWTNMGNQQLIGSSDADTFPYPVTITLDRHGGDAAKKLVYCYGVDLRERIIPEMKQVALENRAFGGALVGGGQGPLGDKITTEQGGLGGIDGGTGGCRCEWRNFRTLG